MLEETGLRDTGGIIRGAMEYWTVLCQECGRPIPLLRVSYFEDGQPLSYRGPSLPFRATCLNCLEEREYDPDSPQMRDVDFGPAGTHNIRIFQSAASPR